MRPDYQLGGLRICPVLRFTFVRDHNVSMASFRHALTGAREHNQPPASRPVNSGPRPCLFDVGFPVLGLQNRTSTSRSQRPCPAHLRAALSGHP